MPYQRDPVSELFDNGARRLLERLYEAPRGTAVSTIVGDASLKHRARLLIQGVYPDAPDPAKAAVGTRLGRWEAGFERALYYNHKWFFTGGRLSSARRMTAAHTGALVVDWGNRRPARGVIPAGRLVTVRLRPGGLAAVNAVRKLGDEERIYDDAGNPAGKHAEPGARDW